jgi:hypothetical protein
LGEQIVQTEEILHGNQEESRQKKETLIAPMLVNEFPSLSGEAPPERLFSTASLLISDWTTEKIKCRDIFRVPVL